MESWKAKSLSATDIARAGMIVQTVDSRSGTVQFAPASSSLDQSTSVLRCKACKASTHPRSFSSRSYDGGRLGFLINIVMRGRSVTVPL
jgi:hypothetical protein